MKLYQFLNETIFKLSKPEKNSKGEMSYWGVKSEKDGRILGKYPTKERAKKHIKMMKTYG